MAKAIQERDGLTVGFTKLLPVEHGPQAHRGSVKQTVHDGDTVTMEADGNLGTLPLWKARPLLVEVADEQRCGL